MKKLKKSLSVLLTTVMVFCMLTAGGLSAFAWTTETYEGLTYYIVDEKVYIQDCDESICGDYVLPEVIDGYPVYFLRFEAFSDCTELTSITIPESVKEMEEYPFSGCSSLKKVVILGDIDLLGSLSFDTGYSSIETVEFGDNVTLIDMEAFANQKKLNSVMIGKNVTSIGERVFSGCSELKEIIIPDGVATIEEATFSGCTSLESVDLPDGLTSIGMDAFADCTSLTSIDIPDSVEHIRPGAFRNTGLDKIVINNRNCTLDYDEELLPEDTVIYGYVNSPAHMYAQIYNRTFIALEDDACPHTFSDWTVAEDADCTQRGFAYRVCTRCCEVETKILPPVGHSDANGDALCDECGAAMDEEVVTVPEKEATDEQTGVSVIYPDGTFDGAAEIQVTPVAQGEAYQLISNKEGNYKVTMFDISVTVDGEQVQPNGMVLVKIPLPKGYNPNKCVVYYVAADGTMEELKTYHVKDGYVWFETDHFSYYAVVEEETESADRPSWMDTSLNFMQTLIDFFNRLAEWFKSLFGAA